MGQPQNKAIVCRKNNKVLKSVHNVWKPDQYCVSKMKLGKIKTSGKNANSFSPHSLSVSHTKIVVNTTASNNTLPVANKFLPLLDVNR